MQVVEHDVCSFGIFSILTMQTRQDPSTLEAGVIAVVGNRDAGFDGRLQDGLALGDRDLLAVDGQRDRIHKLSILIQKAGDYRLSSNSASAAESRLTCTWRTRSVVGMDRSTTASVTGTTMSAVRPFA